MTNKEIEEIVSLIKDDRLEAALILLDRSDWTISNIRTDIRTDVLRLVQKALECGRSNNGRERSRSKMTKEEVEKLASDLRYEGDSVTLRSIPNEYTSSIESGIMIKELVIEACRQERETCVKDLGCGADELKLTIARLTSEVRWWRHMADVAHRRLLDTSCDLTSEATVLEMSEEKESE